MEKLKQQQRNNEIQFYRNALKDYGGRIQSGLAAIEKCAKAKEFLNQCENELQEKQDEKRDTENQISQWNDHLSNVREELKIKFEKWSDNNQHFQLNKQQKLDFFQLIMTAEHSSELLRLRELLQTIYYAKKDTLNTTLNNQKYHMQIINEELTRVRQSIEKIENAAEITPPLSDGVIGFRKKLDALHIPHIPFYKAFDFVDPLSDLEKDRLESAFYEMGILDALLIDAEHKMQVMDTFSLAGIHDKVIFCDAGEITSFASAYLKPENSGTMQVALLQNLINRLFSDASPSVINISGIFKHGIVTGKADPMYRARYVGENSRQRFRQAQLQELYTQRQATEEKLVKTEIEKQQTEAALVALANENESAPKYDDVQTALDEITKCTTVFEAIIKDIPELDNKVFLAGQQHTAAKAAETHCCKEIRLEKTARSYEQAIHDIDALEYKVFEITSAIVSLSQTEHYLLSLADNVESHEQTLDDLRYDELQKEKRLKSQAHLLQTKEEFLKEKGIDEIQKEIERYTRLANSLPGEIEKAVVEEATLKESIKTLMLTAENEKRQIHAKEIETAIKEKALVREAHYEFVLPFNATDIAQFSKNVIASYQNECAQSTAHYYTALSSAVTGNMTELRENNLELSDESVAYDDNNAIGFETRSILTCYLDGKPVAFRKLPIALNAEYDATAAMITENEKRIFEDFLLDTVSNKIKSKVAQSRLWVDKINKIMSARGNAQRIELFLKWDGQKAESEEELSIKKLMEILEDDKKASRDDIKKLSAHFNAKIKNKIREKEDNGEHPNYQMIVREVLDYRQWYEFKLFANKDKEGMKELTQRNFNQLSVGERAMAMYIPLFAAVNARYERADSKCPRVICMDEAFAGISDDNKRRLFTLLRDMNLEYILNSQELWGTYEEVDSLNIYELFREPSDKFVTITKYHWDGVRRTYVD
ncbi:MAG: hypothetical protein LBU77_07180 [Clostridiales bacterium]|nr:hypothetical protein [Clostridiales bacterium]